MCHVMFSGVINVSMLLNTFATIVSNINVIIRDIITIIIINVKIKSLETYSRPNAIYFAPQKCVSLYCT